MALRSGYYGLKNATRKALIKLASDVEGMKVIKSIGDGLKLTQAGKLNCDINNDTMEFKNVKLSAKAVSIQLATMPEASAENDGLIRQYVGPSNANYTKGFFYKSGPLLEKKNPVMTSDTQPSGVASASSNYSNRPAYYAFNENTSNFWTSAANQKVGEWIKYKFAEAVVITKVITTNTSDNNYPSIMKGFKIQASNDDSEWVDLAEVTANPKQASYSLTTEFENETAYEYYRIICTSTWSEDPSNGVGFSNIDLIGPAGSGYAWEKINVQ